VTFIAGVVDSGNHCDDCSSTIALPFPVTFYGTQYTSVNAGSNGWLDFVHGHVNGMYANTCLPTTQVDFGAPALPFGPTIYAFWDDGYTADTASGQGIFTTLTGSSPNQVFAIEWRAQYCCSGGAPVNDYEVVFYEGQSFFDILYGTPMTDQGSATVGVQANGVAGASSTQYECNAAGPTSGLKLRFNCASTPAAGACCSGSTCVVVANAAACTSLIPAGNTNKRFTAAGQACNAPGNNTAPCCKADFNQSGAKSVQDLFDFLAAWFSKTPQADINGNPPCSTNPPCASVTVQDLFDFLAVWFPGC